jgi:cysteine-rich repeat protein
VWGDGIKVTGEEWDDGNATPGDGWDGGWNVETGWIWDGGTIVIADTWSEICGDGIRFNSLSTYCDDGNNADGDGWSMEWTVENGWEWTHPYGGPSAWTKTQVMEEQLYSNEANAIKAITGAGAILATWTSFSNLSYSTHLWQLINIMQLFMLILLFEIDIPSRIVNIFDSTKYLSLSFEISFINEIPFISSTLNYLDFLPPNGHYDILGINSGSALVNIFSLLGILLLILFLHILSYPLKLLGQKKTSGTEPSTWKLVCLKIWKFFTFGAYIRLTLQSYQLLVINSVSGLYNAQKKDISHLISILAASVIGVFWIFAPLLGFLIFYKRMNKRVEEIFVGLKKNQMSRIYQIILMLRKLIFIMWMILFRFLPKTPYLLIPSIYQLGHIIFIIAVRPFEKTKDNIIEIFNEIIFTVILSGINYLHSKENWRGQFIDAYVYLIMAPGIFISLISLGKTLSQPLLKYFYRRNRHSGLQVLQIKKHKKRCFGQTSYRKRGKWLLIFRTTSKIDSSPQGVLGWHLK